MKRPVGTLERYAPMIHIMAAAHTSTGTINTDAITLGKIRYAEVLTPMISMASMCSFCLIPLSSAAMLLPTLPAKTRQAIVGANSIIVISLTIYPI